MDVIDLTGRLIDIPSPTGEEKAIGEFVSLWLKTEGFEIVQQEIEPGRFNILAGSGAPLDVVLCTHLDTVPNPAERGEDTDFVCGRGSSDAKGPMAAMMIAARDLRREGVRGFGLLFVSGEETDSLGAREAAALKIGSRAVVIGEPTGNRMASGHKGVLTLRLTASGKAAHSAFPHRGESAIERLLDALAAIRKIDLGEDPVLGKSTLNIGRIEGGVADNVIAPEAWATVMIRCALPFRILFERIRTAAGSGIRYERTTATDPVKLALRPGYETTVLPFGSDAPYLEDFGERFMIGPGEPEEAHTEREKVGKKALIEAVGIYRRLVTELIGQAT